MTYPAVDFRLGVETPPNPEHLTDHILMPEQGDTNPDKGISVFYGIAHTTEDEPHTDTRTPERVSDVRDDVIRTARRDVTPYIRHDPSPSLITWSRHLAPTDAAIMVLGLDPDRRRAVISIIPDDFTAVGGIAYIGSDQSGVGNPIGNLVCASAVPQSMVREFTASDEIWCVLDSASKPCWISVHIERYA